MNQLTEEQRQRIEENRRKALEKRAARCVIENEKSTNPSVNKINLTPDNSFFKNSFEPIKSNEKCKTNIAVKNNIPISSNSSLSLNVKNENTFNYYESIKEKETLRGTCLLLSRKRFYVDVGYHKKMIDIFKTIPSRLYDVKTKKWNFLIDDHDKLVSLLRPLQPKVLIAGLPRLLLKFFSKATENREVEDHDLSMLDPVLLNALLPFQKIGVKFGVQHKGRVLIADDMGLGKTIQAIGIANYFKEDWPLLIVAPSSVRYTWLEAFHTWLPSLSSQEITIIGSSKEHIPNNKVIIMSYDLLTKMKEAIEKRKFKMAIMDESHFLKNGKSARTKAAIAILKNINRIIMLSGTPALSRPIELYTQLSILRPRDFFGYVEYGIRYCNGKKAPWGWDFHGSSNMEELQILLEEIVMIRRLKSEVIKQLPAKYRQMIVLDPSRVPVKKVLKALAVKLKGNTLKGMEWRGLLLQYFHETGDVKLKAVCEYILDLLESERKFVCFAHHQNVLNGICDAIEAKKIDYIRIDGSVAAEQRKKLCDKFQLNDTCKVAVLSITAANCGITLTAASLVIFAELFWNPGILTQAEDRVHRIGQEDYVVVQYLVARGTADDEIWPLVQKKLDILNKAGLSKDTFVTADTVVCENSLQPQLENFWDEINTSLDISEFNDNFDIPEKRLKLDI